MHRGIETPWGVSQYAEAHGEGITFYGTAGHGGFFVEPELNQQIPEYLRRATCNNQGEAGWYEEDCDWSAVAICFPDRFTAQSVEAAKETLRGWQPEAYERHYNVVLAPGESYIKDQRAWYAAHADDLITICAFGDWHAKVPKGFVGVVAVVGGRSEVHAEPMKPKPERWFLVPAAEYRNNLNRGFVIDPARHQEIEALQ